ELLEQIVLRRAAQLRPRHPMLFRHHEVQRQDERRRRVDRHRGVDLAEWNPFQQLLHVAPMANRDASLADLACRHRSIRVVTILGWQIERDRESALSLLEVIQKAPIRLLRVAETGVGADYPGFAISLRR